MDEPIFKSTALESYQGPEPKFVAVVPENFRHLLNHRADSLVAMAHPYEPHYVRLLNEVASRNGYAGVKRLVDSFPYSVRTDDDLAHRQIEERQIYNFMVRQYTELGLPKDDLVKLHAATKRELFLAEVAQARATGGPLYLHGQEFRFDSEGKLRATSEDDVSAPVKKVWFSKLSSLSDRVRALLPRR